MARAMARYLSLALLVTACASTPSQAPVESSATDAPPSPVFERRAFNPIVDGKPVIAGISYGPFRQGHAPGGALPSADQILEDLKIVGAHWNLIRIYGTEPPAETILQVIRDHALPIKVMLGCWIAHDHDNAKSADEGIRLANAYPEQVVAVNVGNESQVFWSAHRVPQPVLMEQVRKVRANVTQPVTVADDYNFWNKPESQAVAAEIDFLVVHAYAMWNGKTLEEAVPWTAKALASIQSHHPGLPLVIGETGWATELNPEGSENEHIKAPAGEAEQVRFYTEFSAWAGSAGIPYFYFEAFDEPWKGSGDPREVEKHWGLYRVDRTPKAAAPTRD